jgi:hypothetical protein
VIRSMLAPLLDGRQGWSRAMIAYPPQRVLDIPPGGQTAALLGVAAAVARSIIARVEGAREGSSLLTSGRHTLRIQVRLQSAGCCLTAVGGIMGLAH